MEITWMSLHFILIAVQNINGKSLPLKFSDITNGGIQSSSDDYNPNAVVGVTKAPSTTQAITAPSFRGITTINYELFEDESNNMVITQPTIIPEPYFDAMTPRNVTGLVGKSAYLGWVFTVLFRGNFLRAVQGKLKFLSFFSNFFSSWVKGAKLNEILYTY